jgi:hypothetical protein
MDSGAGRSSPMIKHLRTAQPPRPDGPAPGQLGRAVPGDRSSGRGGSQNPDRLRQTGIPKMMINRWSAGTSVEAIPGGRERRSESYRILTFGGEGQGKPRDGACRLSMVVRPGPSHFVVTLPRLVRWLTPDDEPRRSRSRTRPCTPTVQTHENAPDPATSCHFWGRLVRHLGGESRDSSRSGVGVQDMRCGWPAGGERGWHRCSGTCHSDPAPCTASRSAGVISSTCARRKRLNRLPVGWRRVVPATRPR